MSKYAPRAKDGGTFVDSRFYSTVSVVRTMETLLGLPPMNNNDALATMMGAMFTGPGDQKPFAVDIQNRVAVAVVWPGNCLVMRHGNQAGPQIDEGENCRCRNRRYRGHCCGNPRRSRR